MQQWAKLHGPFLHSVARSNQDAKAHAKMRYETNLRMILKNQPFCRIRQQPIYLYNMDLHFNLGYNAVQEYSQTVGGKLFSS